MHHLQCALIFCGIISLHIVSIRAGVCKIQENEMEGAIADFGVSETSYTNCWKIPVPANRFIRLQVQKIVFPSLDCTYGSLKIKVSGSNDVYRYCETTESNQQPITALRDVQVEFNFWDPYGRLSRKKKEFKLGYIIQDVECANEGSFHCSNYSCIPKAEVCDGIEDCENGKDESKCETGIATVPGIKNARLKAISWLKNKRSSHWGWQENTPRAITALFLAEAAYFNGSTLEEDLMAKQTELKTAVALLKHPISNEQLSLFIHALLVTCHSPRHFYGQDLIKRLKDRLESANNFTHPVAYLALCNANETWPSKANMHLINMLKDDSDYSFFTDIQAFAVMAISCHENRTKSSNRTESSSLKLHYRRVVEHFKKHQLSDGSFGNVHTTALVTQALLSSGQEHAKYWKLNSTIKFLMEKLNSTKEDFVSYYLTLPVLNGRSLADIYRVNCSGNLRSYKEDDPDNLINDMNGYNGPKMRVQYSLFVGDEKDIIHTISLRVPENLTAYQVMQIAEEEDPKYKFEWKKISGKLYVFKISKWMNDPELGMFWLLYLGQANSTDDFVHDTISLDQRNLSDGSHLIMWYKKAHI